MPRTLSELLTAATATLAPASDSPRLDAELLLAHALAVPRSRLRTDPGTQPPAAAVERFEAWIVRRAAGEPLAYLVGEREFWSLALEVDPTVLVPRPETETLVAAALAGLPPDAALAVLDLGTGSGAIAIALAHERPRWRVTAVDRSAAALAVAARNCTRHAVVIELLEGRWFAPVAGRRFDLVVANPPYVAPGDPHLAALAHEPREALVSGDEGLADLAAISAAAPAHLVPGGRLLLEHGADQGPTVRRMLERAGFDGVRTATDGAGRPRVGMGTMRT